MTAETIILIIASVTFISSMVTLSLKLTTEIQNLQNLVGLESLRIRELLIVKTDELKKEIDKLKEDYVYYEPENKDN